MRNSVRANIELGAQIAIAIAVLVVSGVLVKRLLFPRPPNAANMPRISVGERLNVSGADWKQNGKSLVFFLNKDCHYCTTSAPFYRQLIEEVRNRNVKALAILPNPIEEAKAYVRSVDLPIEDIRSGLLSSYNISGTPTVVFVNSEGIVRRVWFGAATGHEMEMREQVLALIDEGSSAEIQLKQQVGRR